MANEYLQIVHTLGDHFATDSVSRVNSGAALPSEDVVIAIRRTSTGHYVTRDHVIQAMKEAEAKIMNMDWPSAAA